MNAELITFEAIANRARAIKTSTKEKAFVELFLKSTVLILRDELESEKRGQRRLFLLDLYGP